MKKMTFDVEKNFKPINYSSLISIRVPDFIKKELQQESESNHITINANIAKILIQHIEWNQFVQDSGFVYTNHSFLKAILGMIDIKEIETISKKHCVQSMKSSIMYIYGEVNKNILIKTLESWLRTSHIPFRRISRSGEIHYVIQHGLGEKWSKYFSTILNSISAEINWNVNISDEKDTISFAIEKQL